MHSPSLYARAPNTSTIFILSESLSGGKKESLERWETQSGATKVQCGAQSQRTSRDFSKETLSMKVSYIRRFFALFLTMSRWNVARSWKSEKNTTWRYSRHSFTHSKARSSSLTKAHSAPSSVATMVAARGVLYMSASSPKLPLLSYFPTHTLAPSFCTKISYTPLDVVTHTQTKEWEWMKSNWNGQTDGRRHKGVKPTSR